MRVPTLKTLESEFRMTLDPAKYATFRKLAKAGKHRAALHAADSLIDGYGGCDIYDPAEMQTIAQYVNTGDSYSPTLLQHKASGAWRVTTWADYVESLERRRGRAWVERLYLS